MASEDLVGHITHKLYAFLWCFYDAFLAFWSLTVTIHFHLMDESSMNVLQNPLVVLEQYKGEYMMTELNFLCELSL